MFYRGLHTHKWLPLVMSSVELGQDKIGVERDRESPWKIPLLILIGLDVIDPSAWLRCKVVFHYFIFYAIKLTVTGQIL